MCNFKDYYKFPLKSMPGLELIKVLTDDNQMAFDWCQKISSIVIGQIIDKINGTSSNIKFKSLYIPEDGTVYCSLFFDRPLLRIRGWGHLTGTGGLNLSEEKAKAVQDEFGEYIVKMLNL